MREPEVAAAVPELVTAGLIPEAERPRLLAVARGDLISARGELRTSLWLGVTLLAAAAGRFVQQNLDRIGPVAIAIALGVAALSALGWVAWRAPRFTWGVASSDDWTLDFLLLLGALLAGGDLAFIEAKFTALGAAWPYHLLAMALGAGVLAFRFDSRLVFSLALSTFAAWRGVAVSSLAKGAMDGSPERVRWNLVVVGALFMGLGFALRRLDRKAHFEPAATHLGALFVLGGLASGVFERGWTAWDIALFAVSVVLVAVAWRDRRFWLFAMGVLAAYLAALRFLAEEFAAFAAVGCFFVSGTAIGLVVLLFFAHRKLEREEAA